MGKTYEHDKTRPQCAQLSHKGNLCMEVWKRSSLNTRFEWFIRTSVPIFRFLPLIIEKMIITQEGIKKRVCYRLNCLSMF